MMCIISYTNDYINNRDDYIKLIFNINEVYNSSCGLPLSDLDSDKFIEALIPCDLNQACLAAVFCLMTLLVEVNLYELVDLIEGLYLAVFVNHAESPIEA
jgi:hypothetical protein